MGEHVDGKLLGKGQSLLAYHARARRISGSVPGPGRLNGLARPIVLVEQLLRRRNARGTRRELRPMLAGDDLGGGRRGVKLLRIDVSPARDTVNVLVLVVVAGPTLGGLALPLRHSRLFLH